MAARNILPPDSPTPLGVHRALRLERALPARLGPTRRLLLKPYSGDITMFSNAGNSERQRAHWAPLAGGKLVIYEVPAGHFDMAMPPHSKILAEQFDTCLDAVAK